MTPADFLPFGQGAGLDDLPRSLPALMSMSMKSFQFSMKNFCRGPGSGQWGSRQPHTDTRPDAATVGVWGGIVRHLVEQLPVKTLIHIPAAAAPDFCCQQQLTKVNGVVKRLVAAGGD